MSLETGGLEVPGPVDVGGALDVSDTLEVGGESVFHGAVSFEGGVVEPDGALDMRYVLADDEARDVALPGAVAFDGGMTLDGPLDVGLHQVVDLRLGSLDAPPGECSGDTQGAVYFDTNEEKVRVCLGGRWLNLGFGGCGDGMIVPGEACDDFNLVADDGCSPACDVELGWTCGSAAPSTCGAAECGDGLIIDDEECDDDNAAALDGCDEGCVLEPGWACAGEPTVCTNICGDHLIVGPEECDDGNRVPGDGCDDNCQGECGSGRVTPPEQCDDGNQQDGDGCTADCRIERGWYCQGDQPSVCDTRCQDGIQAGDEQCDDGNDNPWDMCSPECRSNARPPQCEAANHHVIEASMGFRAPSIDSYSGLCDRMDHNHPPDWRGSGWYVPMVSQQGRHTYMSPRSQIQWDCYEQGEERCCGATTFMHINQEDYGDGHPENLYETRGIPVCRSTADRFCANHWDTDVTNCGGWFVYFLGEAPPGCDATGEKWCVSHWSVQW